MMKREREDTLTSFSFLFKQGKIIKKQTVSPKGKASTEKAVLKTGSKPFSRKGKRLFR